jgi:nicotinate-nucleotide adenylyltransferase
VQGDLRSLGILGGTFNPPHLGHVAIARHALSELGLERVLLMPARIPPHKLTEQDPGPEHRLRMCRLAVDEIPGLSVSELEVKRDGPSYTVDTLQAIHASHPEAELTFIVGTDVACTLPTWREPAKVLELASLAVAVRAGDTRQDVLDTVVSLNGSAGALRFLDMPVMDVSSSMVRQRVARGKAVEDLLGPAVARYVAEHGLYGSPAELER